MIIGEGLPFISDYLTLLNEALKTHSPGSELSRIQRRWLSFVILGVLVTNTLCWARFERFSLGSYKAPAICWIFRRAKVAWDLLLLASVAKLISHYGLRKGVLVIDDTDSERSKNTKEIAKVHVIRDKKRAGFFRGQNIVFLLLVTDKVTLPVGFEFYEPDPALSAWRREDKRLRKKGVAGRFRPSAPERNPDYPTKTALGLKLLKAFRASFESFRIKAVLADAAYNTQAFFEGAAEITGQRQVISQLRKTQLINAHGKYIQVQRFFEHYKGKTETVTLRHQNKKVTFCTAKFKLKTHTGKHYIIALKYEGESDYRYLIAKDMSWRDVDVIKAYALRWLVETFIQDWKSYEGWDQLAMQRGTLGSERGLTISLLCDHALHFHEDQVSLYKANTPAATVGSLREKIMMASLTAFIETIVSSDHPKAMFEACSTKISELFELRASLKHRQQIDFGELQPVS